MDTIRTFLFVGITFALGVAGCDTAGTSEDLPEDVDMALEAAIESLDDSFRDDLGLTHDQIREFTQYNAAVALAEIECERHGLLAGLWSSAALGSRIGGIFIEIGGPAEGTLEGNWAPLDCNGCPEGGFFGEWESTNGNAGEFNGLYDSNYFRGEWSAFGDDNVHGAASGEMVGYYNRIHENGGVFVGIWSQCDGENDDPDGYDDPEVETDDDEDGANGNAGNADGNAG